MDPMVSRVKEKFTQDNFPQFLGIQILELRQGYARVAMKVKNEMLNFHGITHGGAVFALADTALGLAANSRGNPSVALQVSINFISPSKEGSVLTATASEDHLTRKTGIYSIAVEDEHGQPVALLRGTVYRLPTNAE